MEQKQGLKNFVQNIKPVMMKCKDAKNLTQEEKHQIVEFYLEVVDFISK